MKINIIKKKMLLLFLSTSLFSGSLLFHILNTNLTNNYDQLELKNNKQIIENSKVNFVSPTFTIKTNESGAGKKDSKDNFSETITFNFTKININKILNNYIFGNFRNYKNWKEIILTPNKTQETFNWYHTYYTHDEIDSPFGLYWTIKENRLYTQTNHDSSSPFEFSQNLNFFILKDASSSLGSKTRFIWTKVGTPVNDDASGISTQTITKLNNYDELEISQFCKVEGWEWNSLNSFANVTSRANRKGSGTTNINFNVKMPYSQLDLNNFCAKFTEIMSAPILLKNRDDPIIFNYLENNNNLDPNSNEALVNKEIQKRIKQFYSSDLIKQNILGKLVDENGNNYSNVSNINMFVDPNIRGKSGSQVIKIIFSLANNREFCFDGINPSNTFSVKLPIYISLNPEIDFNINDLVTIKPYISANEKYQEHYLVSKSFKPNLPISSNQPNENELNLFHINLNQKLNNFDKQLIPNNKFPIINKLGTELTIDLKFRIINKNNSNIAPIYEFGQSIKFERLFDNGNINNDFVFNSNEYNQSPVKFKNNILNLSINMDRNKIWFYNQHPIELISNNNDLNNYDVEAFIENVYATIPSEQVTSPSKWYQIKDSIIYDDLQFMGEFETFNPFIFRLKVVPIAIKDPITGVNSGYASKYKPFIRKGKFNPSNNNTSKDENIFSSPQISNNSEAYYEANFGNYVMKNKTDTGQLDFQIVIKEFDPNSNNQNQDERYTKDRWIISISMHILNNEATFKMVGYDNNKEIQETNKNIFFNKESSQYRGDYVDEKTGMYIPKIVWVNAFPPQSFLYDPLNEKGEKVAQLVKQDNETEQQASLRANYDIGYIAQLNANGFSNGDYTSLPTIGSYTTIFDEKVFVPNGIIPYRDSYTYNKNNLIPNIKHIPISQSGAETAVDLSNFNQIVLKRTNSNNYLFQFIKIAQSSKEIDEFHNIIDLYGTNLKGLNNKPLFVDFFDTYQGKHLTNYLIQKNIIDGIEKIKELSYCEIMQYWNIYVNDPSHYDQSEIINQNIYDISKLQSFFNQINLLSIGERKTLVETVINTITQKLQKVLVDSNYLDPNYLLQINRDFIIEVNQSVFNEKIDILLNDYNVDDLNAINNVKFNIKLLNDGFKNQVIKPYGQVTMTFINNKNSNKIIDLSKYQASILSINTKLFNQIDNLIKQVKDTIYESINNNMIQIFKQSAFSDYVPILNEDYKLKFYSNITNNNQTQKFYYNNINEAINEALLFNCDQNNFYNILNVEIEAIFDNNHKYMINSFNKLVINNSNQNQAIIEFNAFDLSTIKPSTIKVNTNHKDFIIDPNQTKAEVILNLIKNRINRDINFYARKWLNTFQLQLKYNIDYKIKFIQNYDQNNKPIYYDSNNDNELIEIINDTLINPVINQTEFNIDLSFAVISSSKKLQGFYVNKINNCNLNQAIEPPVNFPLNPDDNNNQISGLENIDLTNKTNNDPGFDWWWVITPITVFSLTIIGLIIFHIIRKNRRIR